MARYKDICVLLPVLNEVSHIERLINGIRTALQGRDYVICFVDDGSRDGTAEYISAAMQQPSSRIYLIQRRKQLFGSERGSALHTAMMWAFHKTDCRILIEMDGDLSHRPEELTMGIGVIESGAADVAIASKYLPGSRVTNRTLARNLVSLACSAAVRLLVSTRIRDYSNGYRFYTRAAARSIAETHILYANPIYLSEVLAIWISRNLRIVEFPSHYVGRDEGVSKLRLIDLLKASIAIFEISFRLRVKGFQRVVTADLTQPEDGPSSIVADDTQVKTV